MRLNQRGIIPPILLLLLGAVGCDSLWAPFLANRSQSVDDLSLVPNDGLPGPPDLRIDCQEVPDNLLLNPSFEALAMGANPNGRASNTGHPASTIPGAWIGCCSQMMMGGSTQWVVSQKRKRCGMRSLMVSSAMAEEHALTQELPSQSASVRKRFQLSGFVLVQQISDESQIWLDVASLPDDQMGTLAATAVLSAPTNGWFELSLTSTVPDNGWLKVRINNNGSMQAYVDDSVFRIQ